MLTASACPCCLTLYTLSRYNSSPTMLLCQCRRRMAMVLEKVETFPPVARLANPASALHSVERKQASACAKLAASL